MPKRTSGARISRAGCFLLDFAIHGRKCDAADVSFATLFGSVQFNDMEITMQAADQAPQFTSQAVALA